MAMMNRHHLSWPLQIPTWAENRLGIAFGCPGEAGKGNARGRTSIADETVFPARFDLTSEIRIWNWKLAS